MNAKYTTLNPARVRLTYACQCQPYEKTVDVVRLEQDGVFTCPFCSGPMYCWKVEGD